MIKQPWGPWKDCTEEPFIPLGEFLLERADGTTTHCYNRHEGPWARDYINYVRFALRLPDLVRTVDVWVDINEGYKTGLTAWSVGAPDYITSRSALARLTIKGELGKNPIKAEWM